MNEQTHEALHRLWTKAVAKGEDYNKKEWLRLESLINDAEFRAGPAFHEVERRRYALLQAAAALYSSPSTKLNRGDAIDLAEALLAEIKKRESK